MIDVYVLNYGSLFGHDDNGNEILIDALYIGTFLSEYKALKVRANHEKLSGFRDDVRLFHITKFTLDAEPFCTKMGDENLNEIWRVIHFFENKKEDYIEYTIELGQYSSKENAKKAKNYYANHISYKNKPGKIVLGNSTIDLAGWTEGFRELNEEESNDK